MSAVFLVIDGYGRQARDDMDRAGTIRGGDNYAKAIRAVLPDCKIDIIFAADAGTRLDQNRVLETYTGAVWTGSSLMVDQDDPQITRQIELMRELYAKGVATFGSCWGLQIACIAAGGTVRRAPSGSEFGVARKIKLTSAGRGHPIFVGKGDVFDAFCIHRDHVDQMPPGSVVLASNRHSYVQAAEIIHGKGRFCGVQYHPEFDCEYMAKLTRRRQDNLVAEGFFNDVAEAGSWADRLMRLHKDPNSSADCFALGLDEDVLDRNLRFLEFRNWAGQ
ncbi:MAG: type 1 glutamine amidotransferase [Pseudomonadota bacterium]